MQDVLAGLILFFGETLIGGEQAQRHLLEPTQPDQHLVIRAVDPFLRQDRTEDAVQHVVKFLLQLEQLDQLAVASGVEQRLGLVRRHRREGCEQRTLAVHAAVREVVLPEEVLQLRGMGHHAGRPFHAAARVLGGDQVGHGVDQPAIVRARQHALGARQVVVEELRIGESAADIAEEGHHFAIVERAPGGHGDLKRAEADCMRVRDPLDDVGRGEADHADHGVDILAARLFAEDLNDPLVARRIHRVAFARRAKHVEVVEVLEYAAYLAAKHLLQQPLVVIPRNLAGNQNCLWIAGHRVLSFEWVDELPSM